MPCRCPCLGRFATSFGAKDTRSILPCRGRSPPPLDLDADGVKLVEDIQLLDHDSDHLNARIGQGSGGNTFGKRLDQANVPLAPRFAGRAAPPSRRRRCGRDHRGRSPGRPGRSLRRRCLIRTRWVMPCSCAWTPMAAGSTMLRRNTRRSGGWSFQGGKADIGAVRVIPAARRRQAGRGAIAGAARHLGQASVR